MKRSVFSHWMFSSFTFGLMSFSTPLSFGQEDTRTVQLHALEVDAANSSALAITGRAGLFGFLGHEHAILAKKMNSQIFYHPNALTQSRVYIEVFGDNLEVDTPMARQLAKLESGGPSTSDIQKIEEKMKSPDVLDVKRFPIFSFSSVSVEKESDESFQLRGFFFLHGFKKEVVVPVKMEKQSDETVRFLGGFKIKQTDFGIQPVSIAGVIKVEDEVKIQFNLCYKRKE